MRKDILSLQVIGAIALLSAGVYAAPGSANSGALAAGSADTAMCQSCHSFTKDGAAKIGPSLSGVVGRPIASAPNFKYSNGLKAKSAKKWTPEELDAFLANPSGYAPGTTMPIRVADKAKRQRIIAYLATLGS